MKIFISPAKKLASERFFNNLTESTHLFPYEINSIIKQLKKTSHQDLMKLMSISEKLADLNYERNQKLDSKLGSLEAIKAFQGEVYKGISQETLNKNAINYVNKNLFIISGLYGLVKPNQLIQAYRLEMGSKFEVDNYKNLYKLWKKPLTDFLKKELKSKELILNLASDEYSKAINFKEIKNKVVKAEFYDLHKGKLKKIMVYLKKARGSLLRYCAENNVENIHQLFVAEFDGYRLDSKKSTETNLIYTR